MGATPVLERDVQKEVSRYAGQWVVIAGAQILGVGETPQKALDAVTSLPEGKRATLYLVPEDGDTVYFF